MSRWGLRLAVALLCFVVAAEIGARGAGAVPYQPTPFHGSFRPSGWLQAHPDTGWTLAPGVFDAVLGDTVFWRATHPAPGERGVPGSGNGAWVRILGDSVPYGFGVDDGDTFAARLAHQLPELRLSLHAVPGHSLAQTRAVLDGLPVGERVVVTTVASWLDERTTWLRHWRKSLAPAAGAGVLPRVAVPVVRHPGAPTVRRDLVYRPWPLQGGSAAVHAAERAWLRAEHAWVAPHAVGRSVLAGFVAAVRSRGAVPVVVGVADDAVTQALLDHVAGHAVVVRAGLPPNDPVLTLAPVDPHPSPAGHQALADALREPLLAAIAASGDGLKEGGPAADGER